jgi:hypothetical protein
MELILKSGGSQLRFRELKGISVIVMTIKQSPFTLPNPLSVLGVALLISQLVRLGETFLLNSFSGKTVVILGRKNLN